MSSIYTSFTNIAASSTATDDVTDLFSMEYLIQTCNIAVLLLPSNFT